MSVAAENVNILGPSTDLLGNQVNVFYEPKTQKFYQSPIGSTERDEVINPIQAGSYNNQFATSRNRIDSNYQAELSRQIPNSTIDPQLLQTIQAAQNNFAIDQGSGDQLPDSPDLSPVILETVESKLGEQLKIAPNEGLKYPSEMQDGQDRIKFLAVKLKGRKTNDSETGVLGFSFASPDYEKVDNPVFIGIQNNIRDQNAVDWSGDNVNAINSAAFKLAYGIIDADNVDEIGNKLGEATSEIFKEVGDQQERIKRLLAGQAASINNVLARTDNVVLNPNLELLFQGPQLRPFNFTFKMSARNATEAVKIKKIIKYFKYHMAVRKETGGLFLRAPNVFTIQYKKGVSKSHPGINIISPSDEEKACALTNFSVDYTPMQSYMTLRDPQENENKESEGTMVTYVLNMTFQEITPIYDTDYKEDQVIGY